MMILLQQDRINELQFQLEDYHSIKLENEKLKEEVFALRSISRDYQKSRAKDSKPEKKFKLTAFEKDMEDIINSKKVTSRETAYNLYEKKYKGSRNTDVQIIRSLLSKLLAKKPDLEKNFKD